MKPKVLVVDDDAGLRYTLAEILTGASLDVTQAKDGVEALALIRRQPFDLVLSDLRMPRMDGLALLAELKKLEAMPRVIVITAHGSERTAVEAMKAGAWDYFRKPFEVDDLLAVVGRAVEAVRLKRDNARLTSALALSRSLVFASEAMERLATLVERVAPRDVTVLITGESGTGKERVAEAIVRASKRADRPFVRFNCAALTPELVEAELFGHSKGAFTGALKERPGLFREAHRGTLLLDEVGELDASTQAKLLRVLQEGEVRPVGEDRPVTVDVRVIAATHRDLKERVAAGHFREDLYWRLHVVELHVPPLRERPDDIVVLARHFLDRFSTRFGVGSVRPPDDFIARLQAYAWPGNVRELEHTIERLLALSPEGELDLSLLPDASRVSDEVPFDLKARVDAYEKGLVVAALSAAGGNRSEAARRLGLSRVTLLDKLKKYGIGGDSAG